MGSGSAKSFQRVKAILDRLDNFNSTFTRGSIAPICSSFSLCSQCSACTGEARWPNQKQAPVYFVSEVLNLSKKNYTELEKVLYAVLMASRKLRHYFHSSQPLKDIMRNKEATGRIGKWAAELNEFTIDYVHRSSIQSKALANFIADWTPGAQEEETNKDAEAWTIFCDDSWGTFGAGAAAVLVAPSKVRTCYAARLNFSCTNNIAEYKALLLGLRKLKAMGIRRAILKTDSQVISGHVDKSSKARDPKLEKYLDIVRRLEASFEGFSVKNIPRGENEHADLLAKSAAQGSLYLRKYFLRQ
jgi:ribonuclease HI